MQFGVVFCQSVGKLNGENHDQTTRWNRVFCKITWQWLKTARTKQLAMEIWLAGNIIELEGAFALPLFDFWSVGL